MPYLYNHPLTTAAAITLVAYGVAGWAVWKRATRAGGKDA